VTGCLGFGTGRSRRTHRGASGPIPKEVYRRPGHQTLAPAPGSVRSHTQGGCKFTVTLDGVTGRTEGASCALSEKVQLAVNVSLNAQCSASGATLPASSAPIFSVKLLADPWT